MIRSLRRAELLIEAWLPAVLGGAAGLISWIAAPRFFKSAADHGWSADVIYSATFDVATVLTAFLFAFYTFVLTQEAGFIGRMKRTPTYGSLLRFTASAMWLGAGLVVVTIPMMVTHPQPTCSQDPSLVIVAAWAGLAVWSFAAFVRASWIFGVFARPDRF